MTHTHALRGLLAHGPLTWREMLEITGWKLGSLKSAIARMDERGEIRSVRTGRWKRTYWLA